ncbi:SH3 domain-containing protein [Actinophytocola sp.]|uniref:SH3 domain-containing protein n=1 Tax=Actinophytocola sp. TaxID=1872138 RepID=UPI002D80CDF3|nr:SH3 domain-containing protein [Actinophytocola sp.]HET9138446.1 SH3 domain-containing protein [Actinophytocola sp.]
MASFPKRPLLIGGAVAGIGVLYLLGGPQQDAAASDPNQCRITVTADVLRVRAAPALNAEIVGRLTQGQQTNAEKVVQDGFRKIDDKHWVAADFTQTVSGHDCG